MHAYYITKKVQNKFLDIRYIILVRFWTHILYLESKISDTMNTRITALIITLFITHVALPQSRKIEVDDFFKIKNVGNPQISPDGEWVAYTVTETNLKDDKRETSIWMVPHEGGEPLRMTTVGSSAGNPRWSPDGKYLSFTASRNKGKSQVWALDRRGGEAQQLTKIKQGVSSYVWSPNGESLALLVKDPKPEPENKEDKDKPEPYVIDRLQFKRDYAGYLDRRRTHLYVFNLGDTAATQLTFGDYDDSQPAWSPDGKSIAFVSNRTEEPDNNSNSDIWVISADGDKKEPKRITTNPGSDRSPSWSPDGKTIVYLTGIEPEIIWYATTHLATISSSGGNPKLLTKELDRNVGNPSYSEDGSTIYFTLEDSAERHLASIGKNGGSISRLTSGGISLTGFSRSKSGNTAVLVSTPQMPREVFKLQNGKMSQLTKTNEGLLDEIALGSVENITFNSKDGTEVEGFVIKPPEFKAGTKYPTILKIHGGPVSQYDHRFYFEMQMYAAQGYVVVFANPRGSSGYGQEFSKQIWQDWGNKDFDDVNAAVDYVVSKGYADPDRLGVGGWSYGGILTNYVITKTGRFKGAISGASEVLYVANYGHDHYQRQWEKELGLPWENRELWEKISPFNYLQNVTTPTLVMGGALDWNVPIHNSEQMYQVLKRIGKAPTQLIVYPGEHHGIRKPSFQKDRLERYLAWYKQYVKGEPINLESK